MSTDVIMPQMGESIAEGTVTKWLKNVGDPIARDEPLFEISTDKVDAEIPAPAEGVLLEIVVPEGETVDINTVVARIGQAGELVAKPAATVKPAQAKPAPQPVAPARPAAPGAVAATRGPASAPTRPVTPKPGGESGGSTTLEERLSARRRTRSSPLVRKIAGERGVDISLIDGTGTAGRVTKKDILRYIQQGGAATPAVAGAATAPVAVTPAPVTAPAPPPAVAFPPGERVVREKMSVMRRKIAEHMMMSRQTSAHVQTWQECDMGNIARKRAALKDEFERGGVKLTYTAFIAEAIVQALQAFPMVNASIEGQDTILYHQDVNLGIAVALDWGLIVPVVKHAEQMNLKGLAGSINDLADRARTKRLSPEDVQGGTFTITNPGVFGSLMGAPIINQPQVAILGVGVIKKRPVVIDDAIAIRPVMYLSLSFDHRLVDGAVAAKFLATVAATLEDPS